MAVIDGVLGALSSIKSPYLAVHPERCILIRNRNAQCLRCAQHCAAGAISYDGTELLVDPDLCIGCGTCATSCPTCALESAHPADEDLFGQAARLISEGEPDLVVSCARAMSREYKRVCEDHGHRRRFGRKGDVAFDTSQICQVVCLGRLDEAFYIEAAARGARKITLVSESCDTCKYRNGGCVAVDVWESAEALIGSRGRSLNVEFVQRLPEWSYEPRGVSCFEEAGYSRRDFFLSAKDAVKDIAAAAVMDPNEESEEPEPGLAKVGDGGTLPQYVPVLRNRLFNSLRALGPSCGETVKTRVWGQVKIDVEACSSCRMCAVFCPTGALTKFDGEGGVIGISHRSALCVQCRLCESICPKGALVVSDEVSLDDFEHGRVDRVELKPLSWHPNKPDAIFSKVNGMFGGGKNNTYF